MSKLLRWPGGKQWLAGRLAPFVGALLEATYFEPFLGSGAMFFRLRPHRAILSDRNRDLIATFRCVRRHHHSIATALRALDCTRTEYYCIRESEPECPVLRAARFIYLNRTCFGGLYRVNRTGRFNVPYGGRTTAMLLDGEILRVTAQALRGAKLDCLDFATAMSQAGRGDVLYCDPIYVSTTNPDGFNRYGWGKADWDVQMRLRQEAEKASERGAIVLVSNPAVDDVLKLYQTVPRVLYRRHSCLAGPESKARQINEALFILGTKKRPVIS